MNWITATRLFLIVWVAVPVVWNFLAWANAGDDATISMVIADTASRYPWFPIIFSLITGMLLGHWFWPLQPRC